MLRRKNFHKSVPNFQKKCDCFDNDHLHFYTHSFVKPKGKVQFFEQKDGETFVRESRSKIKSWMPRSTSNVDFFDPVHKAALCFFCYLNETDGEQGELLKIRPMKLVYHLDDETFSMNEPYIGNSGHIQGRIFYRQKVPREEGRETVGPNLLSWKDLSVGEDVVMFGKKYHIVSCDNFTKNFYQDRGITIRDSGEDIPIDAWTMNRHFGKHDQTSRIDVQLLQSLQINEEADFRSWENLPLNFIFHLAWLDSENDFHGSRVKRTFRMLANTSDDTVTLTETTPGYNNALFLRNVQLPYITKNGIQRHYRVRNMRPGSWIDVFKRPMFIYDCEGEQTILFVRQQYGEIRFGQCSIDVLKRGPPPEQFQLRPSQLLFYASNEEFPKIDFLIIYNYNERRIDVFEAGRLRPWTKSRPFLVDVDASHIDAKNLKPGSQISLFRWHFTLKEAHPHTHAYLSSMDVQPTTSTVMSSEISMEKL